MKKLILIAAASFVSYIGFAQDPSVVSARMAQQNQNYDEAVEDINKAILDPETAKSPKTWLTRANIYYEMEAVPKYKAGNPYREATKSFMRMIELKPDMERDFTNKALFYCAQLYYNDGITAYQNRGFDSAYSFMQSVVDIHNIEGGKRFASVKAFDTIVATAQYVQANCLLSSGHEDDAMAIFLKLKENPIITSNPPRAISVYTMLINMYKKQNKDAETIATIQEAKKLYPDDQSIRNEEINYYIKTGKQDELTKKLEDAVAKDPNNPELYYNLGVQYYAMAFPDGKDANMDAAAKAEQAYKTAVKLAPDNGGYNYNLGAMYFNEATDINTKMNGLGTSAAEEKKYNELKVKRDALFNEAIPYLEKASDVFGATAAKANAQDHATYISTLTSLKQIYAAESKMDKVQELQKKLDAFK